MHFYVYDESLSSPKLAHAVAEIETRLTDLGLQGRIGRLGPLKSANDMIRQAIRSGATTVVAVGNDRTVADVINALAGSDVALGVIPIGSPTRIAELLGVHPGEAAVETLAARKIETVDLGKINNHYFLTSAEVSTDDAITLECDEHYTVSAPAGLSVITIANLSPGAQCQDGYLEATIESSRRKWLRRSLSRTVVPFRQGRISSHEGAVATVENSYTVKLPTTIEIIPRTLRIVVGRERAF
ncbi:MAG: diacylglycerol kinase family protein [Patescibacteria group bacterium]|jgi:diacylglycerol kinase family enzyme